MEVIQKNEEIEEIEEKKYMPQNLEEFLIENTVENETTEITLCERLKNFKFKIGIMTRDELEKYQRTCSIRGRNGKVIKVDNKMFENLVITNHCIYPNFKSLDFLTKLKVNTPEEAIDKTLKVGERQELLSRILEFNGFDEDFEDLQKQAKNS